MNKEIIQLNHTWNLLLEQLLEYLQAAGYRQATIAGYRHSIKPFLFYLQENELDIREVVAQHIQSYQALLTQKNLSSGARHKAMSQVKTLFKFLHKTGRIYYDPAAHVELPKKGHYLPRAILTVDEATLLMKQPDLKTPIGVRNRAILELMYSSGLRNQETTLLDVTDIDLTGKTVFVHGKGGKEAVVPFGSEAAQALEHYLYYKKGRDGLLNNQGKGRPVSEKRRQHEKGANPLFLTAQGYRMLTGTITHLVKYYTKMAGIQKPITPHCLRHACATHLLKNGADIRLIQRLLRHGDISSTQIYTRVAIEDLKEAQSKYHPREKERAESF